MTRRVRSRDVRPGDVKVRASWRGVRALAGSSSRWKRRPRELGAPQRFSPGCDGGNTTRAHTLARYTPRVKSDQDFSLAAALFRKSCDAKVSLGCTGLGQLYATGRASVKTIRRPRRCSRNPHEQANVYRSSAEASGG